jgi:hypothetical protein
MNKRQRLDAIVSLIYDRRMPLSLRDIHEGLQHAGYSVELRTVQRDMRELIAEAECEHRQQNGLPVVEPFQQNGTRYYRKAAPQQPNSSASRTHPPDIAALSGLPEKARPILQSALSRYSRQDRQPDLLVQRFKHRYRAFGEDPLRPIQPTPDSNIRDAIYLALTADRPPPHSISIRTLDGESRILMVPIAIVHRGNGIPYLVAGIAREPDLVRAIPMHLITSFSESACVNPGHYDNDLDTVLYEVLGVDRDPTEYTLHVERAVAEELLCKPIGLYQSNPKRLGDGRFAIRILIRDSAEFRAWIKAKGTDCEVVSTG